MSIKTEATVEDLAGIGGKAELVNGEIVHMSPTGILPGFAGDEIYASLLAHSRQTRVGHAFSDNKGFLVDLPHRRSFSPDASYYLGPMSMKFAQGAPVFAVEVRSEGDSGPAAERDMADKRADYFAAGTLVVWDVDLESEDVIRSYQFADPASPTIYRRGEMASAEPAVPGWSMPVDDLFPHE